MAGSGIKGLNINSEAFSDALTVASGGITGGISSTIAGGDFWQGMRHGLITTGLNHIQHKFVNSLNLSSNGESTETASDCPKCKEFWAKLKSFANDMGQAFYQIDPNGAGFDYHMNLGLAEGADLGTAGLRGYQFSGKDYGLGFVSVRAPRRSLSAGALRASRFANSWGNASLKDAINKFAPGAKASISSTGKHIYLNKKTGIQIVYDKAGKYFRIENTNLSGKRVYLDMKGNIPNNKTVNGKTMGRSQAEYNQATHFNIK